MKFFRSFGWNRPDQCCGSGRICSFPWIRIRQQQTKKMHIFPERPNRDPHFIDSDPRHRMVLTQNIPKPSELISFSVQPRGGGLGAKTSVADLQS